MDRGGLLVVATAFDERNRVTFNIFVKDLGERTKVRVNASFRAVRDDATIECYSNGTLESWIFDSVQELIEEDG